MSDLPKGWAWATLGDLATNLDRMRIPVSATERGKRTGQIPYYGAAGQVGTIDEAIFNDDLLLLGEDGVQFFDPYKPKAYRISGPSWVNNHAHVFKARSSTTNAFLLHYLNHFDYEGFANGTTRLKLTKAAAEAIPVPLPPLAEQHRIVEALEDHLSRLDAAVSGLKAVQKNIQSLVAARSDPDSLSAYFERVELRHLVREPLRNGHSGRSSREADSVRCLTITAVTKQDFSDVNTKLTDTPVKKAESLWLEDGDIFVQRSNTPELVGSSAIYRGPDRWAIFPDLLVRVRVDTSKVLPDFASLVLQSKSVRNRFRSSARGLAGSMPKISQPDIERVPIPLMSLDQQAAWVTQNQNDRTDIQRLSRAVHACLRRALSLRKALLTAAFTGQLVDQDPSDEPASVLLDRIKTERAAEKPATRRRTSRKAVSV